MRQRLPLLGVLALVLLAGLVSLALVLLHGFRPELPLTTASNQPPTNTAAAPPPPTTAPARGESPADDPLAVLNQEFRAAYRHARATELARSGPVILVEGNTLVLLRDGRRTEVQATPPAYHTLKVIAHIPLALYVLLETDAGQLLPPERLDELTRYRERVLAARQALPATGLPPPLASRQERIFGPALEFLDAVLARRQVSLADLTAFTRRLGPLLLANVQDAARLEIDSLNRHTKTWRQEMTPEEWQRLRVVVIGSAMPRRDNLAVQFFARLLGEAGEGSRLVYAESLWEEPKALDLLGTHLLDSRIGDAFFGDAQRMHRDLLGDAARDYLKQLPVEP